jgi:hypothetical protein
MWLLHVTGLVFRIKPVAPFSIYFFFKGKWKIYYMICGGILLVCFLYRIYKICRQSSWKLCVLWLCKILCIKLVIMLWFMVVCWDVLYKWYIYDQYEFYMYDFMLCSSKGEMWHFQISCLNQWSDVEGSYASCLRGATRALYNGSLRLPIIGSVDVRLQCFIRHQFCA